MVVEVIDDLADIGNVLLDERCRSIHQLPQVVGRVAVTPVQATQTVREVAKPGFVVVPPRVHLGGMRVDVVRRPVLEDGRHHVLGAAHVGGRGKAGRVAHKYLSGVVGVVGHHGVNLGTGVLALDEAGNVDPYAVAALVHRTAAEVRAGHLDIPGAVGAFHGCRFRLQGNDAVARVDLARYAGQVGRRGLGVTERIGRLGQLLKASRRQ